MYKQTFKLNQKYSDGTPITDGLKLLVIGGTHGNESNAVDLVSRLKPGLERRWDPSSRYGITPWWVFTHFTEVTIINALNPTGLKYNERAFINEEEPPETDDLNRYFKKSQTHYSKEDIMGELEKEIAKHDVIVDVHNTANCQTCISIALNENAPTYTDFAMRNKIKFVLADDTPTIKRYADIVLHKVAFTLEIGDMGFNTHSNEDRDWKVRELENFLKTVGDIKHFDKNFRKTIYINDSKGKVVEAPKDSSCFSKHWQNTFNLDLLRNYKMINICTYADGLYDYHGSNPLRDYRLDDYANSIICDIVDPINRNTKSMVVPPCNGWLVDVDESYWACEGGTIGDFQPDLPKEWWDFYEKEAQEEREKEEKRWERLTDEPKEDA